MSVAAAILLLGCSSKPTTSPSGVAPKPGVFYKDDGPPTALPADLDRIADAEPRDEPLHRFANRPYNVFGVNYTPLTLHAPLVQRGTASWYGRKFHGQKTAIGETYDMFAMSAAHPTAPLPSYARVTNVRSQRSVIVRVNDRGPFLAGRIVDLSYAAAHRLGIAQAGSGEVQFELLLPPHFNNALAARNNATAPTDPTSAAAGSGTTANASPQVSATARATSENASGARTTAPIASAPMFQGEKRFFVQLGAFGNFANASAFQSRVNNELGTQPVVRQSGNLFRVQLGPFASEAEAQRARDAAQSKISPSGPALPVLSE